MMIESVYLGLRLTDGVDTAGFESRFGITFATLFEKPLEVYTSMGLLENANGRCRLSPRGMLVIDSIASSFIDQI